MNRFTFCRRYDLQLGGVIGLTLGCVLGSEVMVYSQSAGERPAVTFTAEQDHQNMMNQLGIKTLRQGARAAIQLCGSVERRAIRRFSIRQFPSVLAAKSAAFTML